MSIRFMAASLLMTASLGLVGSLDAADTNPLTFDAGERIAEALLSDYGVYCVHVESVGELVTKPPTRAGDPAQLTYEPDLWQPYRELKLEQVGDPIQACSQKVDKEISALWFDFPKRSGAEHADYPAGAWNGITPKKDQMLLIVYYPEARVSPLRFQTAFAVEWAGTTPDTEGEAVTRIKRVVANFQAAKTRWTEAAIAPLVTHADNAFEFGYLCELFRYIPQSAVPAGGEREVALNILLTVVEKHASSNTLNLLLSRVELETEREYRIYLAMLVRFALGDQVDRHNTGLGLIERKSRTKLGAAAVAALDPTVRRKLLEMAQDTKEWQTDGGPNAEQLAKFLALLGEKVP
ncbi:MAG: hypothetical protein ACRD22_11995 [Terriglobia bacterium]